MNRSIEISLFDFNEDIYGKTLRVKFLHFIRHDERFDSLQEMKDQIKEDERQIRALLF
ncbi:RNA-binding riboflavin kinase RibR [compost metagenome]